jgi:biotin transport system substrate-specific component
MAIAAHASVSVPFSPVPITGQTLAIPILVALLGTRGSVWSLMLYLGEGFLGLPVFSHAGSLVPTLGYLIAFPLCAWLTGALFDRGMFDNAALRSAAIVAGSIVVLAGGWAWLATIAGPQVAFVTGVAPFLIGDLIKSAIAAAVLPAFRKAGTILR